MYGNYGSQNFAPVKMGEEIDVKIEAVGEKGDGVAKVKGFVIFVPNTNAGDEVRIKINKVLTKVGFGEVIGQASGPVVQEERHESPAHHHHMPEPEPVQPQPSVEDTEDFGEEPAEEEPAEEEPAEEEPAEEEPKEESQEESIEESSDDSQEEKKEE